MKIITSVSLLTMFIVTSNAWAAELVDEQQATFYYQVPFGGIKKADNTHKFGFRVDRVTVDRLTGQYGDSQSFNDLMKRPASLDFQLGHNGVTGFKIHGYDYLPQFISKADEEATGDGEVVRETDAGGPEANEPKESDEEKYIDIVPEMNQTTFGIMLGIGIGILALTGFGG